MDYQTKNQYKHQSDDCNCDNELCHTVNNLRGLIQTSMLLVNSHDRKLILNSITDTISTIFLNKWCVLRQHIEDTGEWEIIASTGLSEETLKKATKIRYEDTLLGNVVISGVTEGVDNLEDSDYNVLPYFADEIKSILVAPVLVKGKIVATLKIYSKESHLWSNEEHLILSDIANILGMALGNAEEYDKQKKSLNSVINALSVAMEVRDYYTQGHSERVARLSVECAKILELSSEEQETLHYAAILHDVGKIGISESILNKKEPLLDDEWKIIKDHPTLGESIIARTNLHSQIGVIIRYHHERWDGEGYPNGLIKEEIPLLSRIICVSDAFDAMTTNRSYRPAMKLNQAVDEIVSMKGKQFDPLVVDAFLKIDLEAW